MSSGRRTKANHAVTRQHRDLVINSMVLYVFRCSLGMQNNLTATWSRKREAEERLRMKSRSSAQPPWGEGGEVRYRPSCKSPKSLDTIATDDGVAHSAARLASSRTKSSAR